MNISSSLKLRYILSLNQFHFTLRPFYSPGRSSHYPLNVMLTGPQIQSEGCRERNFSISCRKSKVHFLFFHHVASTLTQIVNCNYYTLIKSGSSSVFSVPHCCLLQNTLIRVFLINMFFLILELSSNFNGLYFINYKRQMNK